MKDWAALFLRLGAGAIFVVHGLQKMFGFFGGQGIQGFSEMLTNLGFTNPLMWAHIAAYVEIVGGLFLIFGIFVRTSSFLLFILLIVAAVKVHLPNGFFISNGGVEYVLTLGCMVIALITMGGGKIALMRKG
ncbi:MAG: DoxX family protein [Candidatus Omnitrophota bacterium]